MMIGKSQKLNSFAKDCNVFPKCSQERVFLKKTFLTQTIPPNGNKKTANPSTTETSDFQTSKKKGACAAPRSLAHPACMVLAS